MATTGHGARQAIRKKETDDKPIAPPLPQQTNILVVDDDPAVRDTLVLLLAAAGYETSSADNGFEALRQLKKKIPAVLLCDLEMPGMSGLELLSIVRRRFPGVAVIAMSGCFGDEVPEGVTADAFYSKGQRKISELFRIVADVIGNSASGVRARETVLAPIWGRWIGTDACGTSYVLVSCADCLRSFPIVTAVKPCGIQHVNCLFCRAEIHYIADPSMTRENPFSAVFPLLVNEHGAQTDPGRNAPRE